jgi:hypothetical protein
MSEGHEIAEELERATESNRKVALLIAILALFLALAQAGGKGAQTEAIAKNIEASDIWAFFQAKTIRGTTLRTAAELMETQISATTDAVLKDKAEKRISDWQKTADRYDSDPQTREGRKELMERAKAAEEERDLSMARYHHFELASAAFEIGIVLASATVITGILTLGWIAAALGLVGLAFVGIAVFVPQAVHLV